MANTGMDTQKVFGEVVRQLRNEHRLTQAKLAERSDLHTNYVSLLERGQRQPTLNTIFKIARSFDLQPHDLIKRVEEFEDLNS